CDQRAHTSFERRDALLEHRPSGVHNSRVDIPEFLQREEIRSVVRILENVRRGLIDGDGTRSSRRVGLLSSVQCESVESKLISQWNLRLDLSSSSVQQQAHPAPVHAAHRTSGRARFRGPARSTRVPSRSSLYSRARLVPTPTPGPLLDEEGNERLGSPPC